MSLCGLFIEALRAEHAPLYLQLYLCPTPRHAVCSTHCNDRAVREREVLLHRDLLVRALVAKLSQVRLGAAALLVLTGPCHCSARCQQQDGAWWAWQAVKKLE